MTSTVGSLLGVPTTTRLTIGTRSINTNNKQQPTPAAEAREGLRLTQAQQHRRRRRNTIGLPPKTTQQELLAQQSEQHLAVEEMLHLFLRGDS
eukprot:6481163-Amphidinium_carterae.2